MAINRYSRLTPSKYDPLSLEEQIMVPLAKQKQQEDLLTSKDAIETELNNLQRLQQDDPFVTEQTQKYKESLDAVANNIASEGINRETSRNFRKLYSDYKFDISNSGDLGRAQKNYLLAKEREKEARASLQKAGHSQDKIDQLIRQGYENFSGTIGEDGLRNEFGNFGGPGFYDYRKEAIDIMSRAKASGFSIGESGSDIEFITDPTTGYTIAQVTNTALTKEEKDNAEQIASAYNSMVTSYEYGDRKEFAELYDLTPEKLNKEFKQISGAFESKFTKDVRDARTSVQVVGKPKSGSTTEAPSGDIWENIPTHARAGKDGADPLGNRLTSDSNLTFRNSMVGFRRGTITDFRDDPNLTSEQRSQLIANYGKPGANNKHSGSTTIEGPILEDIFRDPNFLADPSLSDVKAGARGAGIFNEVTGDDLTIIAGTSGLGREQLAIQGTYGGQEYNLTITDPNIVRAFDKFGTTPQGKSEYSRKLRERKNLADDLRRSDDFMLNMSDEEILGAYEEAIAGRSDYFQNGYKPKNVQNSYYSQSEDLFGKGANMGTIATRKVRLFNEDGSVLADFKSSNTKDMLSNLIMDEDWDDLDITEREEVINQLNQSTDYGLQVGDHEFVNPMRRSITTKDGQEVFFMIDNNNELSGKNKSFAGIDDSSEMQKYLIEGKPFVAKPSQFIQTRTGENIEVKQWFIQIPRLNNEGKLEITPLVIYGKGNYDNISDFKNVLDFETLKLKGDVDLHVETQADVDARVKTNLNKYYDKVRDAKNSNSEANKRQGL